MGVSVNLCSHVSVHACTYRTHVGYVQNSYIHSELLCVSWSFGAGDNFLIMMLYVSAKSLPRHTHTHIMKETK